MVDDGKRGHQPVDPGLTAIGAAGTMLAERGIFGMAWLDRTLVVRTRYGRLIDFVAVGLPITDTMPPLIGLEDDILALPDTPGGVVELPAVAIVSAERQTPRFNISVFWFAEANRFLLVVSRAISRSDLEAQLSAQMRARLMAEAEVKAKSNELARANTELSRANRDLEDFASIIAHDLSGPMRSMRYLADDLDAVLEAGEAADGQTAPALVGRIRAQAARLSSMLRDLHEYSSIGRKQDALEETDTRALVDTLVTAIHRPDGFAIVVGGDWPHLTTLAAPLDLVLRNLVENAVKHHDRPDGRVEIIAHDEGLHLAVSVRDDGPGIDALNQEAVFMPFRTLGRPGAGTGMGLAFVKRTVESVGGSLTLASAPQTSRGAEFRILWPKYMPA